jgi:hypothetical protein
MYLIFGSIGWCHGFLVETLTEVVNKVRVLILVHVYTYVSFKKTHETTVHEHICCNEATTTEGQKITKGPVFSSMFLWSYSTPRLYKDLSGSLHIGHDCRYITDSPT